VTIRLVTGEGHEEETGLHFARIARDPRDFERREAIGNLDAPLRNFLEPHILFSSIRGIEP
jgi:hypothetical protein